MYEEGRRLYTEEINAAVRGATAAAPPRSSSWTATARASGWTFNSLMPDLLDPRMRVRRAASTGRSTPSFLEEGCDAALFVGMHARAPGSPRRRAEPHGFGAGAGSTGSTTRSSARPGSMRRCAGRGLAGAARHRRPRRAREAPRAARAGADGVEVKGRASAATARGRVAAARARELIEEGARAALADLTRSRRTTRVARPRSSVKDCRCPPPSSTDRRYFLSFVNRKVLAAAFVVALTSLFAVGSAFVTPAIAAGSNTTYLVLAPQGLHRPRHRPGHRRRWRGVVDYGQIGVLVAASSQPLLRGRRRRRWR